MESHDTNSRTPHLTPAWPPANVGHGERLLMLAAGTLLLGYAWRRRRPALGWTSAGLIARGASGYCPAYAALGVDRSETRQALAGPRGIHIRESIHVAAPAEELYTFWRRLEWLPEVMPHLERVEQIDSKRSRWTARAFGQLPVSWEAEIINEVPFETIAWQTLPGEIVKHAGSVVFTPRPGGGTDVEVHLQYAPPGGRAAAWFAALAGQDPAAMTRDGLQALQQRFRGTVPANGSPARHS
jgi:uncharacterized membrane protein